jgi:predicted nucleotidyltransferase/DNA-binding XRE family transcriptional regulator
VPATVASAGELLREARRRAGLSQTELARRAGVAQSVISAYESGRRQPALPTLLALIKAAGLDLHMELRRPQSPLSRLSGPLGRRVRKERAQLVRTAAKYGVSNLRVFGSVARGEENADSDIDLLVDLPNDLGLLGLGRLQHEMEIILGAPVDLVPTDGLKPQVREVITAELVGL